MFALITLIMAGGCSQGGTVAGSTGLQTGNWQARITLPGGDFDTGVEIGRYGENCRAGLVNRQERIEVAEVGFSSGLLLLRFPAFNNEIKARLEDGKLVGSLTRVK